MDLTKKRKLEENGDSDSAYQLSPDDVRKIIEPFTPDQLLDIVKTAALRHLDVLDAVRSIADRDPAQRKLFIRGLGWDTTTENLRLLFSAYGDLEEAVVILDKATGKSKGYGFVTFRHVDGALLALREPSKKIDGRMTVTQLAAAGITPGGPTPGNIGNHHNLGVDVSARKIYVGNVPYDMAGERLLAHFLSYGEIEEGPLGFDKATGKSKGYALFVYKTAEAARASLVDPIKTVDGHQLNCKLAIDGKRAKQGGGVQAPGTVAAPTGPTGGAVQAEQPHGNDATGSQAPLLGSLSSQYGGPGGITSYGGLQGPSPLGHHPLNLTLGGGGPGGFLSMGAGGQGLTSLGGQAQSALGGAGGGVSSAYGSALGGPYGHFGGPGSTGYAGLGTLGGSGAGLGGSGLAGAGTGLGASGRGTSLYGLNPSSAGLPSGSYPESAHYSLSSSGYQSQHHQTAGTSPAARVPPGGMYHGLPPYY